MGQRNNRRDSEPSNTTLQGGDGNKQTEAGSDGIRVTNTRFHGTDESAALVAPSGDPTPEERS